MKKIIKHYTESILYDMEQTARVMKLVVNQLFNELNITIMPDEYCALDVISCRDGICQRDLAKIIIKDRANTGRILNSLEEKGLITRFVDTKNNRLVRKMSLTEKGYKKILEINEKIEKKYQVAVKKIPEDEIENLQKLVRKFRTNMEELLELKI